jgi:hypothetical protein
MQADVVRVVVLGLEEVRVVGCYDRQSEIRSESEDPLVELLLALAPVRLYLEVIPAGESLGVPGGGLARSVVPVSEQVRGQLARHAGRRNDQSFAVLFQQFAIDPRPGVEAFRVPERGELDEVAITRSVGGEEDKVEIRFDVGSRPSALATVSRGHVGLHPDDRAEAGLPGLILELPRRVKIPVVSNRQRRLFELEGASDQVTDAVRPIQEGVLAVAVQVDEAHRGRN